MKPQSIQKFVVGFVTTAIDSSRIKQIIFFVFVGVIAIVFLSACTVNYKGNQVYSKGTNNVVSPIDPNAKNPSGSLINDLGSNADNLSKLIQLNPSSLIKGSPEVAVASKSLNAFQKWWAKIRKKEIEEQEPTWNPVINPSVASPEAIQDIEQTPEEVIEALPLTPEQRAAVEAVLNNE